MSTNKKIRKIYDDTFKTLTETSANHERMRQITSQLKQTSPTANLPITLTDVRVHLFSIHTNTTSKATTKARPKKTIEIKPGPAKKAKK
jgi:hypothetical protein